MKFIITENRFKNVVFKYLDNQDFIIKKQFDDNLVFVNSENDERAVLILNKKHNVVGITEDFLDEITSFFSMDNSSSRKIISEWVCDKLGVEEQVPTAIVPLILVIT